MGTLGFILLYAGFIAYTIWIAVLTKSRRILTGIGIFLIYLAFVVAHVLSYVDGMKDGQIEYYKHGFDYIPIVHKLNDIPIDTIYVHKEQ